MRLRSLLVKIFLVGSVSLLAEDRCDSLFRDLAIVREVDQKIFDRLPVIVNYQLQGGYFTMPSARSFDAGVWGFGFSHVPPYRVWNMGFQFFDRLETTGNYWVYRGILEGNFGHLGFGEDAERAANCKILLYKKLKDIPLVPNLAVGWNDFFGSCRFSSFYAVATQEFLEANLEATVGWGNGRIHGWYGGAAWSPFRKGGSWLKGLSLMAEYDANDYEHHGAEHPKGRVVKNRVNAGVQFSLGDLLRFSASTLRGTTWAASGALQYNLGTTKGFFPKIYDPPIYAAPIDREPLGERREERVFAEELAFALQEQGFDLYSLKKVPKNGGRDALWLQLVNVRYREEEVVRDRLEHVLGSLLPQNVEEVTVVMEADGILTQEYAFLSRELLRYSEAKMGPYEMRVISPTKDPSFVPNPYESRSLYTRKKPIWILTFRPWVRTFFGSSRGKFKYETGLLLGFEGYLFQQIYYGITGTYTGFSSMHDVGDHDMLHPSRLINVRTDSLCYNQASSAHLEQAFLQRSWTMGKGWYSRLSGGYFEPAYGGVAGEVLYYPVHSSWAIGASCATVWKRKYFGLGFTGKIRKLTDEGYQYFPYTGVQYFLNLYYDFKPLSLDFQCSIGQFLARDKGMRLEGARTFSSGLKVGLWYTLTNGHDIIHRRPYYDKGFFITLPLDFFLNKTSRSRLSYSMSAWLRDVGAQSATGKPLYPTLYWERYNYDR